jgi:hypothetical protein
MPPGTDAGRGLQSCRTRRSNRPSRTIGWSEASTLRWCAIAAPSLPKTPLWKKGGHLQVPQRRSVEGVSQRRITLSLLKAELLVRAWAVEDHVAGAKAEYRRKLRAANGVRLEVAEHLRRLACNRVAGDTSRFAEEEQRTALSAGRRSSLR